jgi:SAM-dependent methyltransferase
MRTRVGADTRRYTSSRETTKSGYGWPNNTKSSIASLGRPFSSRISLLRISSALQTLALEQGRSIAYPLQTFNLHHGSIWLQDLANALSQSSPADREYIGFDISAQHFPDSAPPNTVFKIHNILEPFPADLHGQFDLVHIRLLVLALAKDQFKTAVHNALELLKPGGFIQWEEFENANHKWPSNEVADLVRGIFENVATKSGLTRTPCADVTKALVELGCEDVKVVDYNTLGREELDEHVKEWARDAMKATLYPALLRDGKGRSEEETRKLADDIYERCEKSGDAAVRNIPLMRVVGRKGID